MAKTNFQDVYIDDKGPFYYEVSLGNDKITGKRIKKKSRKDSNGKKFTTAKKPIQKRLGSKMTIFSQMDTLITI